MATLWSVPPAWGQTETIRVDIKLLTGGSLGGLVVDHTDHGLVIVRDNVPYVFAWDELEAGSAYRARRDLLGLQRGGLENLTAEDHFQLGLFALSRGRAVVARNEFRQAKQLDDHYEAYVLQALDEHRRRVAAAKPYEAPLERNVSSDEPETQSADSLPELIDSQIASLGGINPAAPPSPELRAKVRAVYDRFGAKVREVMGKDVVLIETAHFLIWTDFNRHYRERLASWCETMYAALCEQFDLDASHDIFLAKCPVFCWRLKVKFLKFARLFDGYAGDGAVGYTRSIEKNGHVHIVLLLNGHSEADLDRFASTVVHEGTHAFIHRLHTTRLIPHWVNEGCADLMAERVLKDRCPNGENAALLARQYVRYDWPIADLLGSAGPIAVHQYPLAVSVIEYLESLGSKRFAGFIKSLKEGATVGQSLAANYDGLTLAGLEARWRVAIREHEVTGWKPVPRRQ